MPTTPAGRHRPLLALTAGQSASFAAMGWRDLPWSVRQAMTVVAAQTGGRVLEIARGDDVTEIRAIDLSAGDDALLVMALLQWEIDFDAIATTYVGDGFEGRIVVRHHHDVGGMQAAHPAMDQRIADAIERRATPSSIITVDGRQVEHRPFAEVAHVERGRVERLVGSDGETLDIAGCSWPLARIEGYYPDTGDFVVLGPQGRQTVAVRPLPRAA
jgi:hypothetical protein